MRVVLLVLILILLYLFLIMPGFVSKKRKAPFLGVLYAHRGFYDPSKGIPENSMAAFQRALEAGYGIETDVQLSKDGIPVLFHDATLKRMTGQAGRPLDYTIDELKKMRLEETEEGIPLLEDFLKMVNGKVPLIIELKIESEDDANLIASVTNQYLQKYAGAYVIESFNPEGVLWYRKHRPDIIRGQLSEHYKKQGLLYFALTNLLFNFLTQPGFIAYNHKDRKNVSRWLCRNLFHNLSVAWTVQSEAELKDNWKEFDIFIFDSFVPENGPHGY